MRSRTSLFALLFIAGSLALPHLAHASIPFFGHIIPDGFNVCPAGWGMLMVVINNIIELLLTIAIVFVAPIMIAYAGFLYVVNPFNPSGISKAKSILINTIVGIVIALAGWMIVDAIMAVLYNPGNAGGAWSSLITSSGDYCLPQKGALPQDPLDPTKTTPGVTVVPSPTPGSGATGMNVAAAVSWLKTNVTTTQSSGICLTDIQYAFKAGGITLACPHTEPGSSGWAGSCNGPLQALRFTSLGSSDSSPQAGDVVVIQHINGSNTIGHIAMFTGSSWVSDFIQSNSEVPPGNPFVANQFGGAQYWRP